MGYFNRDNNRSGRDNRGGGFRGQSPRRFDDSRPRQMFTTVCSNCGNSCEVPFRPTSGKPVYCSDCFEKVGGRASDGPRFDNPRFERPRSHPDRPRNENNSVDKSQLDALNAKLDRIIDLLTPKSQEVKEVEAVVKKPKADKKAAKVKKEEVLA